MCPWSSSLGVMTPNGPPVTGQMFPHLLYHARMAEYSKEIPVAELMTGWIMIVLIKGQKKMDGGRQLVEDVVSEAAGAGAVDGACREGASTKFSENC